MQEKAMRRMHWHDVRRVMRFVIAGVATLIVYYGSLYGLTDGLGYWYIASATIAMIPQHGVNFWLMKRWAFEDKHTPLLLHAWPYVRVSSPSFVLNIALLHIFVEYVGLWYMYAQVIVTGILGVIVFLRYDKMFGK